MSFFQSLSNLDKIYFIAAILGGILFVIQLALQFLGGDSDGDLEVDSEALVDSDISFKILSFKGLTAFFMMFGLVGLALSREFHLSALFSLVGAALAGYFSAKTIQSLFNMFKSFESSGTLDLSRAIGQEATVYLTVPKTGTGQIQVSIQGRLMTMNAKSLNGLEFKTGERVIVTGVQDDILSVDKLN